MADLQFVGFALMPGPVRKEKQFGQPDDFCKVDLTILSRMSHPALGFPAVFRELKLAGLKRRSRVIVLSILEKRKPLLILILSLKIVLV